jgi:hypothetical protein
MLRLRYRRQASKAPTYHSRTTSSTKTRTQYAEPRNEITKAYRPGPREHLRSWQRSIYEAGRGAYTKLIRKHILLHSLSPQKHQPTDIFEKSPPYCSMKNTSQSRSLLAYENFQQTCRHIYSSQDGNHGRGASLNAREQ